MQLYKSRDHFLVDKVKNKRVLSVGCADMDGKGSQFFKLKNWTSKVYGLDYDKSFCDKNDDVHFVNLNEDFYMTNEKYAKLPHPDDIDIIVMTEVLEHLNTPITIIDCIKKNWPGKKLLFSVPNGCSIGKVIRTLSNDKLYPNDDHDHLYMFNFRVIRNILERNDIKEYRIDVFQERALLRPIARIFKHFGQSFCVELTL